MKEDVLEQVVDDYLKFQGYFTIHNVPFKPRLDHPDYKPQQDSVPSDIDVLGYHPRRRGRNKVMVVNCKAWQGGFDATALLAQLEGRRRNPRRRRWRQFRELWKPKWSEAFRAEIARLTGQSTFHYRIAVTRLRGDRDAWATNQTIRANLQGSTFGFLTLEEMWREVLEQLTTRPAPSELGRLAQLLKAADLTTVSTAAGAEQTRGP